MDVIVNFIRVFFIIITKIFPHTPEEYKVKEPTEVIQEAPPAEVKVEPKKNKRGRKPKAVKESI